MNRVYKLIWSKTKNMYVVVCEYAKSHTKSVVNKNVRRTTVAGVLFSLLSCMVAAPVTFAKTSISASTWRTIQNSSVEYKIGSPSDTNDWYYAYLNLKTGAVTYCMDSLSHSNAGEWSYYKLTEAEFKSGIGASNLDLFNNSIGKSNAIKALSISGKKITYTKEDGTTGTLTTQDTTYSKMTGATASAAGKAGLVPAPAAGKQTAFLRGDGTWVVPTNTTYSNMKAATASAAGTAGLVPAPAAGKQTAFLRGDGTWAVPTDTNTTYGAATDSVLGLVKTGANITNSSGTISLTKANVVAALGYTPPTADTNTTYGNMKAATASAAGTAGLVPAPAAGKQTAFLRGDGTWVVPTDTNTTYSAVTQSANGLMTAADKKKLDGIATGANAYSLPTATGSVLGGVKTGANITNSSGTISLTKANVTAALGYTPPTQDTNTTYAAMSADELATGTATASRSMTAKVVSDYVKGKTDDKISGLSINGSTITYTKGNGTAGTLSVPVVSYPVLALSDVNTGTSTTANTISAKVLNDYVSSKVLTETNARSDADTVLSNRIGSLTADGNYIKKADTNNISDNLLALDRSLHDTNQNLAGFASDITRNKDNIREMNASVSAALDSVSATGVMVDTINDLKADASLNNLTASGRQVIASAAASAVQEYMASNSILGMNRLVMMSAPSASSNTLNITDAGNGSLHVGEGSYVNGTSSIAIGVGNQVNANNSGAFGDPSVINADASYVLGNDDTVNTGATNSFIIGNDGVSDAEGSLLFGSKTHSTGKNGMAMGNQSEVSAENAVALGYGSVADEENTLSIGNDTLKRRITNMADGNLTDGSSDGVTGSQLYATNERVRANEENIVRKAEADASNIDVTKWAEKLGIGKVEEGDSGLVTGDTVYHTIENYYDTNAVATFNATDNTLRIGGNRKFDGADMIDVSKSDGSSRIITGVRTNPADISSAANVGYVNAVGENIVSQVNDGFAYMNEKVNRVGAGAAAMAGLVPGSFEEDSKWNLSAAVGSYHGTTAGAVGAFYKPVGNVTLALKGSFSSGENMVSGGVGVALNKGDVPGVTKRQLLQTVNAQAQRINAQDKRIERLEAVIQQMIEEKDRK